MMKGCEKMKFNNNDEIKAFVLNLVEILEKIGEKSHAYELKAWSGEFFTTSSEFLGELKLILERISNVKLLDDITRRNVNECIKVINQSFGI